MRSFQEDSKFMEAHEDRRAAVRTNAMSLFMAVPVVETWSGRENFPAWRHYDPLIPSLWFSCALKVQWVANRENLSGFATTALFDRLPFTTSTSRGARGW
jgi:hypothetical protein